jgi:hypothetical protein
MAKYTPRKSDRLEALKSFIKAKNYHMDDFWDICPYELYELCKSRKLETNVYLHVGMVWMRLSGKSLKSTGTAFKRDHTSVSHAEKVVLSTFENVKFGKIEHIEIIEAIMQNASIIRPTYDLWQDYYACQAYLETLISKKLQKT